jgi:hypothetical protein
VLYILEPVFWYSKVLGIFPVHITQNKSGNMLLTKGKLILLYSIVCIAGFIINDINFLLSSISYFIFKVGLSNHSENVLLIFFDILYDISLVNLFILLFYSYTHFLGIFKRFELINKIIYIPFSNVIRIKLIIFITIYQILVSIETVLLSYIFETVIESIISFLTSSVKLLREVQFVSIMYVLYILYKQINLELSNILTLDPQKRIHMLYNLRLAYEIMYELCDIVNCTYGSSILLLLCYYNIYMQYAIFATIAQLYLNFLNLCFIYPVANTLTFGLITSCIRIFVLFWICIQVELEVSFFFIVNY